MIRLEGVEKIFPGAAAPVLRGVSLTIDKGEVFGIIGRSGAGKSTLVRCINMLERPSRGSVIVSGREMTTLSESDLRQARRSIGMVFQHFNLLSSRTVYDNVALPLELAGKSKAEIATAVKPLLDLVGLTDRRGHYPAQLSGGQKQRVGIARALASQPEVLLCDEATSALDPETTKSILALLKDINRKLGLTIVLITHEMQVIKEIADRVAVIEQGQVIEMGRVFDVFTDPASETTRSFVKDVVNQEMPESLVRRLAEGGPTAANTVLRLTFTGPAANDPILTDLVRRFGLSLNILHAHVDYIQGAPFGSITVEAEGADASVQDAITFLRDNHLKAEILGRVGANPRIAA